ncbi:helix-turn-helix domain-containing protein [Anaerophaga thermohalophila]|uniref:helix-turn-helix domain-containing protein n=1 Tax=Anaerophaga thermohalophila TaxID=177400 RepID=UPI000237CF89|nr:helix-turn-helix domain-containing protein [Anaerophaga thermohalophila]
MSSFIVFSVLSLCYRCFKFFTQANLSILKTGEAKAVRFTTLEAICREFKCQPGDILEWKE